MTRTSTAVCAPPIKHEETVTTEGCVIKFSFDALVTDGTAGNAALPDPRLLKWFEIVLNSFLRRHEVYELRRLHALKTQPEKGCCAECV